MKNTVATRPAKRQGQQPTQQQPAGKEVAKSWTKKQPAHSLAGKFKRVAPNKPALVEPASASAPAPSSVPKFKPGTPLVERLPKPLPPAPAPPAPTVAMNPALKARLQDAVAVLAGKSNRRIDTHDRSQARKLLETHADKLHHLPGAANFFGKLAAQDDDETDGLD